MATQFEVFLLNDCKAIQALLESKKTTEIGDGPKNWSNDYNNDNRNEIQMFLNTMEFNIPLLEEVITSNRFDFQSNQIGDIIEVVRMLDILGAESHFQAYALVLYYMLNQIEIEDWMLYTERIPVAFETLVYHCSDEEVDSFQFFAESACCLSFKPLLQYISNLSPTRFDPQYIFLNLCYHGHFELAFELGNRNPDGNDLSTEHRQSLFEEACRYGRLDIAQQMYALGEIDVHLDDDSAFRKACEGGHLLVAQWLYSLGNVDIHAFRGGAFGYACSKGHLITAQWLWSLETFNESNLRQIDMFNFSLAFQHKEMEDWFYEVNLVETMLNSSNLFQFICSRGNLRAAQRLYNHFAEEINIPALGTFILGNAFRSGNLDLVQWLYGLEVIDFSRCQQDKMPLILPVVITRQWQNGYLVLVVSIYM
jgi:hypothetical protein